MRGVTAPNDGQQGQFYWNPTSIAVPDNVNVVSPYGTDPTLPGRWVRDFTNGGAAGSVTNLSPGTGITLTPSPIVTVGTIALAPIGANTILANINATNTPPAGASLSSVIDNAIGSAPGSILYRGATVWTALGPGAMGTVLTISSTLPAWVPGGTGTVTLVSAGQGLSGGQITTSGTISLGIIPQNTVLGNASASSQAAGAVSLTQLFDSAFSSQTGALLYRNGVPGWVALAPGLVGQVLTQTSSLPAWATPSTGSVVQVNTGTGLTGGPITSTGTIQLATAPARTILANNAGVAGTPTPTTESAILDGSFSNATGSLLYRAAGSWAALSIGTTGQVVTTGSSGVPVWGASGAGSVTAVTAGSGLSAIGITSGVISSTGTISLAVVPGYTVLANTSGTSRDPFAATISPVLDMVAITPTSGQVLYRGAGSWAALSIGTAGQAYTVGTSGYPVWSTLTGTGTVTSVALAVPPIFGVSGSPVTTTGTLGVSVVAQGSGTFWAGSSGSAVTTTPSFRQMVSSDFPHNPAFTGNASVSGQLAVTSSGSFSNLSASGQTTLSSSASVAGYMSFRQGLNVNVTAITSAATSYTINPNVDYLIAVSQSSAVAISINLPASPLKGDVYGIKDAKGVAATYPITVVATSGTIDGNSSLSLSTNFGSFGITAIANGGPWMVT